MPRNNRLVKDAFWTLALLGLVAAIFRLAYGLGPTTNLSDSVPWGLWKILNMVAGVALSTSGFTIGFLVYVLGWERFRPLVKPAILLAFLGYGSSCVALLFDIGLPDRFWHPFFMWNEQSFLFEVFWCVMLYFTVTAIELLPTLLEKFRAERVVHWLHRVVFGVVVVGISLSCLHHSSLGSLFLVTPLRLHGLWYSSLLPLFFILSAIGCGMMCLVLVRILHSYWYDPEAVFGSQVQTSGFRTCSLNTGNLLSSGIGAGTVRQNPSRSVGRDLAMLGGLASIAAGILCLYLLLKVGDLIRTGSWQLLLAGTWESWLYSGELILTAVVPIVLIAVRQTRQSPIGLGVAAGCATIGLALNRLNVGIFGYWRDSQTVYFPSLAEWVLSLGVISAAILVFLVITEHFPIFATRPVTMPAPRFRASFDAFTHVWSTALSSGLHRVTLIAVIVLPLAWVLMYPPYHKPSMPPVAPPVGLDSIRSVLCLDGDRAGVRAEFTHADHQRRLGGEESCVTCHHVSLPGDHATPCSRCHRAMLQSTDLFDHGNHMRVVASRENLAGTQPLNHSCVFCHEPDRPKTAANTKDCLKCHEHDMWPLGQPQHVQQLVSATSLLASMHGTCLVCHQREQAMGVRNDLAECGTCHPGLRPRELILAGR